MADTPARLMVVTDTSNNTQDYERVSLYNSDGTPYTASGFNPIPHDVTNSRVTGTIYQNTTGKTMLLVISLELATLLAGEQAGANLLTGPSSPPTIQTDSVFISTTNAVFDGFLDGNMFAVIPPNWYYRVEDTSSSTAPVPLAIINWHEAY